MIRKLRIKFVVINMSIVTILLSIILGMVYCFTQTQLENQSVRMMQRIAAAPFRTQAPIETADEVRLPYFAIRFGPSGEQMAMGGGYFDLSDDEFLEELISRARHSSQRLGIIKPYHLRFCRVDTPKSEYLVFADITNEMTTLDNLMKTCLLIGGLGFIGFFVASILLSGWAVKPVDQSLKRQKQFVADASHELKTPLTVITTNAQIMQCGHCNGDVQERAVSNILTMSSQMSKLIGQMLNLAKTENDRYSEVYRTFDLSKVVEDGVLPFEAVFFEYGLNLHMHVEKDIFISGSEPQMKQLLDILLDNAQKYTKPNGTVQVSLFKEGRGRCRLAVSNSGEPLSKETRDMMFERFYRADEARSRDGSYGLGLAIAKGIVEQHKGNIWFESIEGNNICQVELHSIDQKQKERR